MIKERKKKAIKGVMMWIAAHNIERTKQLSDLANNLAEYEKQLVNIKSPSESVISALKEQYNVAISAKALDSIDFILNTETVSDKLNYECIPESISDLLNTDVNTKHLAINNSLDDLVIDPNYDGKSITLEYQRLRGGLLSSNYDAAINKACDKLGIGAGLDKIARNKMKAAWFARYSHLDFNEFREMFSVY